MNLKDNLGIALLAFFGFIAIFVILFYLFGYPLELIEDEIPNSYPMMWTACRMMFSAIGGGLFIVILFIAMSTRRSY